MKIFPRENLYGEYAVPPDKSITHRAIMLGAIAKGKTTIINPYICQDTLTMIACVKRLGAKVSVKKEYIEIKSPKKLSDAPKIDCGNNAAAMRFICGAAAGAGGRTVLTGGKYLNQQSMREIKEPLEKMGATVALTNYVSAPILVESSGVRPIDFEINDGNSQVKATILFAAAVGGVRAVIREKYLSRNHAEILLEQMGADITFKDGGKTVDLGVKELTGCKISVSRDFTWAIHYLALGVLLGKVVCHNVNVNPTRTTALNVISRMGANIGVEPKADLSGEKTADIVARKSKLKATHVLKEEASRMIDELPLIAFLMGLAEGESVISVGKDDELGAVYSGGIKIDDYLDAIARAILSVGGKCRRYKGGIVITGVESYDGGFVASCGYPFITSAAAVALTASVNGGEADEDFVESDADRAFFDEFVKNSLAIVARRGHSSEIEETYAQAVNMTGVFTTSVTAVYPVGDNYRKIVSELKNYDGYVVFPPYVGELSRRLYTLKGIAKLARGANVVRGGSGYYTEGEAFIAAMKKQGEQLNDKRALVLGCGGLGRGIVCALLTRGVRVDVYDVAEKQTAEYVKRSKLAAYVLGKISGMARYDYVVNTVYRTEKMKIDSEDAFPLKNCEAFVDLTAIGESAPMAEAAKLLGVRVIGGEEMTFIRAYYAACAFVGKERYEQKAFSMCDLFFEEKKSDATGD